MALRTFKSADRSTRLKRRWDLLVPSGGNPTADGATSLELDGTAVLMKQLRREATMRTTAKSLWLGERVQGPGAVARVAVRLAESGLVSYSQNHSRAYRRVRLARLASAAA